MGKLNVYKMHETRMWVKDLILPAISMAVGAILSNDTFRERAKNTINKTKEHVLSMIKK